MSMIAKELKNTGGDNFGFIQRNRISLFDGRFVTLCSCFRTSLTISCLGKLPVINCDWYRLEHAINQSKTKMGLDEQKNRRSTSYLPNHSSFWQPFDSTVNLVWVWEVKLALNYQEEGARSFWTPS